MENLSVLVVDDSALDRESVSAVLREYGSYVHVAKDGNEALACLSNNKCDVAIVDLILPDIYGIELLEQMRAIDSRIEIIIITGHASIDSSVKSLDYGAFAYLIKPIEPELLILYVKRALDKQRAAESLRESEKRFKNLLETVTDYIYTVQIKGGVAVKTTHGTNCLAVTGYTAEEYALDEDLWYRMIYEEDREMVMSNTSTFLSGKEVEPIEHRMYHNSGDVVWVSNTIVPHYNPDGALCAYDGLVRDITSRKEAEQALFKSEASLVKAQKIAHIGSWEWMIPEDNLYWSDEVYNVFGLVKGEHKPSYTDFISRVHPDDRKHVESAVESALASKTEYFSEHRIVREDDLVLFVHEQAELIYDRKGKPVQMSGTVQDVTEYKKNQEILCQTTKLAAIGELAASVAHEINNPMTAVLGYSSLLLEELGEKSEYYNDLIAIKKEGLRVKEIVRHLLDFARQRKSKKRKTNINFILQQTIELVEHMADFKDIKIYTDYSSEISDVIADQDEVKQIYLNVITNAFYSMSKGGELFIDTKMVFNKEKSIEEIHVTFKDNGIGMEESVIKKIFDPFFTTKGENGTGLGLSISYGMVKNHEGDILVESLPGKGSTFSVVIPKVAQPFSETDNNDRACFFTE